jgi:fatty acid desaturase
MPTSGIRASHAKPRAEHRPTHTNTALAQATRKLNLQDRTRWFYALLYSGLVLALGGAVTGLILLSNSWLVLLIAGALGLIFTQFAFPGHEASHRQILASGPANDRIGRVLATLFVGISYSWWMNKHTRHHANPNKIDKDPDIGAGAISFHEESVVTRTGLMAWLTRRQGYFFCPLLLLEGLNLHLSSIRGLLNRREVEGRWLELGLLGARAPSTWRSCSGCCHWAWPSPSSESSSPYSACTWELPSPPTTSACLSSRARPSWTSLASRYGRRGTCPAAGGRRS